MNRFAIAVALLFVCQLGFIMGCDDAATKTMPTPELSALEAYQKQQAESREALLKPATKDPTNSAAVEQ